MLFAGTSGKSNVISQRIGNRSNIPRLKRNLRFDSTTTKLTFDKKSVNKYQRKPLISGYIVYIIFLLHAKIVKILPIKLSKI